MQIECVITYTDPDGERYEAGQLYQVDAEYGLWLLQAAEGQFRVVDDPAADFENERRGPANGGDADAALARAGEQPPVDRMVRSAPTSASAPKQVARGRGR